MQIAKSLHSCFVDSLPFRCRTTIAGPNQPPPPGSSPPLNHGWTFAFKIHAWTSHEGPFRALRIFFNPGFSEQKRPLLLHRDPFSEAMKVARGSSRPGSWFLRAAWDPVHTDRVFSGAVQVDWLMNCKEQVNGPMRCKGPREVRGFFCEKSMHDAPSVKQA